MTVTDGVTDNLTVEIVPRRVRLRLEKGAGPDQFTFNDGPTGELEITGNTLSGRLTGREDQQTELMAHYHIELCPGKPGAIDLALQLREEVLTAFAPVALDALCIWPYDQNDYHVMDRAEEALQELTRLYHAESAGFAVALPTHEALAAHRPI